VLFRSVARFGKQAESTPVALDASVPGAGHFQLHPPTGRVSLDCGSLVAPHVGTIAPILKILRGDIFKVDFTSNRHLPIVSTFLNVDDRPRRACTMWKGDV
jgi:hypothetical protein